MDTVRGRSTFFSGLGHGFTRINTAFRPGKNLRKEEISGQRCYSSKKRDDKKWQSPPVAANRQTRVAQGSSNGSDIGENRWDVSSVTPLVTVHESV